MSERIQNYLIAILRTGDNKILAENINPNIKTDEVTEIVREQGLTGQVQAALLVEYDHNGDPIKDKIFRPMRQGEATNKLTKFNARKRDNLKPDPITETLEITREDFTVKLEHFTKTAGLRTSTLRLLDALTLELTSTGISSLQVKISLSEFMNTRGLKDEKEARKQITEDLYTLSHIRLNFTEKRRGKSGKDFINLAIIGTHGIKKGFIEAAFDVKFAELIKTYNIMQYPQQLYRLNDNQNPHSYYFLRKIAEHKNMNYSKPNADIISVETLLKSSPLMPTYEEVSQTDRHYETRIIEPFERDMNALDEAITWHYCHSNDTPITDEELENFNYDIFIKLLVKITWRYYPQRALPPKKDTRKPNTRKRKTQTPPPAI